MLSLLLDYFSDVVIHYYYYGVPLGFFFIGRNLGEI